MKVVVLMPRLGLATGEMPHLRWPPKNWMPGQNLYYLYTACRALGHDTLVVDANWSTDPIARALSHGPDKVLITSATPTFAGTLEAISSLREAGYRGLIYVGGPHVSLNWQQRGFMLPALDGVQYIPLVGSSSTFDWVPIVFPGRSVFEVLGLGSEQAQDHLRRRWAEDTGRPPVEARLEQYVFRYFEPSLDWIDQTYRGDHVRPELRDVPLRYSIITSIGCSKSCSFCGNPYIYQIGFKAPSTIRALVRAYKSRGIDRISLHDMFFVMSRRHARAVMKVMREEGMKFSMQTCLENLDDELLDELARSGLRKFLVGIENPVSHSVGKTVELDKLTWLLDAVDARGFEGVKLSYIVGLPGASLAADLALLDHIVEEVEARDHPLHDLQVNLYTPYRPEPDTEYLAYDRNSMPEVTGALRIHILDKVSFRFWGSFPVGAASIEDLTNQLVLCDVVYERVYPSFRDRYLVERARYIEQIQTHYPELARELPSLELSSQIYDEGRRATTLARQAPRPSIHPHRPRHSLTVLQ